MNYIFLISAIFTCNNLLTSDATSLMKQRIVGGDTDWINDFKYQVSIQIKKNKTGLFQHGCGGSILGDRFILTAAHCFIGKNDKIMEISHDHVRIVAGTNYLDAGGVYTYIDKVFIPKNYNHVDNADDIAVVQLAKKLNVSEDARLSRIKLPKKLDYSTFVGKAATVSGFGVMGYEYVKAENGSYIQEPMLSNVRKYLQVRIVDKSECHNHEKLICGVVDATTWPFDAHGICDGDSGGPLVFHGAVIGIVSRGPNKCDMRTHTGKFTLVSEYLDFIRRAATSDADNSDMYILSN